MPAGDIGVGTREIGYLFGQYKRITNRYESGVLTGKGLSWGGRACARRPPATARVYFVEEMLQAPRRARSTARGWSSPGPATSPSTPSTRCTQLGGAVVACSDSSGFVADEDGIDLDLLKEVKEVRRGRSPRVRRGPRLGAVRATERLGLGRRLRHRAPCADAERARRGSTPRRWSRTAAAGRRGREHALHPRRRAASSARPAWPTRPARPRTPAVWRPVRWRCSRTPRATRGTSRTPRNDSPTIMRGIHDRCLETAEEYGEPGNYSAGANIAGLHPGRRRDARSGRHLTGDQEPLLLPPPMAASMDWLTVSTTRRRA